MYLGVAENLAKLLITLCTASRKSFSVATFLLALMANMPASVHTLRSSAPVELGHNRASNSYLMSFSTLMERAWILKMLVLPSRSGSENSTFLSSRPGLISAGSRVSGRLVAISTLMLPLGSKPSSWLMSSNIVLWTSLSPPAPSSNLAPPTVSISSKKIRHAFFVLAISKSSLTILAPSPTYFWTSSEPITLMKQASVLLATALAHRVFPVPGGPYNNTPLGGSIPRLTNLSGWRRGVSTTSRNFSICSLQPPTSEYVTSGFSSTCIIVTVGSIFGGKGMWIWYLFLSTPTLMPSSMSVGATLSARSTTNLANCFTLMILVHRATCNGCSDWRLCLSAARSHKAGGASPVSDSLIPASSFTLLDISTMSVSTAFSAFVYWPCP